MKPRLLMDHFRLGAVLVLAGCAKQGINEDTMTSKLNGANAVSTVATLTMDGFEREVLHDLKVQRSPMLVCFHAPWGRDTLSYLDVFARSSAEFSSGVGLDFGSLDLTLYGEVVTRWVDATYAKSVPFSVLFWWKETKDQDLVLHQKVFPNAMPTPWTVAIFLEENDISIVNAEGEELQYSPWAGLDRENQVSYGFSSVSPYQCRAETNATVDVDDCCDGSSANVGQSSSVEGAGHIGQSQRQRSSWIKKNSGLASIHPTIHGITRISDSTWAGIIQRSHQRDSITASSSPLRALPRTARAAEVTATNLVVFIQADCGSCRRKMDTFQRLMDAVQTIDGAYMYIMNCTSDPLTCSKLDVVGFPTVVAFRGYTQAGSEQCVTPDRADHLIRMDYHGVVELKLIMEWFSDISLPAVKRLSSVRQFSQFKHQSDVTLLATTYPAALAGKYLPTLAGTRTWYPLECYRVACERLYGRASCVAALTDNVDGRDLERSKRETDMIVTQVEMFRRDGLKSLVISLGRNLVTMLKNQADSQIHAFHSPHKYNLKEGQHCEDDPASCTDLIVAFVRDHGRLPVTHLTMTGFHTHTGAKFGRHQENSVFDHYLPVLIAIAGKGQLMDGAQFMQALTEAAYKLYSEMVFVSLNTDEFPKWAARFIPLGYRQKMLEHRDQITHDYIPSLHVYPRLCIVNHDDHRRAAMYPAAGSHFTLALAHAPRVVTRAEIVRFARDFLEDGEDMMVETELF